ncbi:prolyl 4-hydroxylase alpha [Fusarium denticulatum]|uniref:Prolyl 4-hydroxylase alpha n=1 Tax=Fusarium denticulatum TaxID=48507 RepID=A0A8H5TAH5_9HYPO|nr:prolyl 4-hydroxylase alpha [Fusarium denticulatum]
MKGSEPRATSFSAALLCAGLTALVLAYWSNSLPFPQMSSWWSEPQVREVPYQVQVFSAELMILYIRNFLSQMRFHISQTVYHVSRRIKRRARSLMGWRNNKTHIQPLRAQKYNFNGFYNFHYDWVEHDPRYPGNRMTTIMVYLEADCEGCGTNFPRVTPPRNPRWHDVIACEGDVEYDEYPGTTFKPIVGSAIYWEKLRPNGTGHTGTRHAGLPVRSRGKMGMKIWS